MRVAALSSYGDAGVIVAAAQDFEPNSVEQMSEPR